MVHVRAESWNKLNKQQQAVLSAAAEKAEKYFFKEARHLDAKLVDTYTRAGVQVVTMSEEQADKWRKIAAKTSYKAFIETVPGGEKLLDMALSVD